MNARNHLDVRRVLKLIDELSALLRVALIEDGGGDVLCLHVDHAEENQLENRHHEREDQGHTVAQHLRQLFAKNRHEAVHCVTSCARTSVSRTNTSSSEGSISCTSTSATPNDSRSRSSCALSTLASMSRCSDVPKIVTARMYGSDFAFDSRIATPSDAFASTRRIPSGVTSGRRFSMSGRPLTMRRDMKSYASVAHRSA